jgi:hypothetical protein
MESLLRWSIENSTPSAENAPRVPPKPIDPEIVDLILGKPDSQLMKEAMEVATDESRSEEERVAALDDMEMASENTNFILLQNANGKISSLNLSITPMVWNVTLLSNI